MKNTTLDLNNHLMAQIERLSDEDLTGEELDAEVTRATALGKVAQTMIANNRLVLDAAVVAQESSVALPEQIIRALDSK